MFKGSLGFAQSQVGEFPAQWPLLTELWLSEAHGDPWQVQGGLPCSREHEWSAITAIWWLLYGKHILMHKLLLLACPQNDISASPMEQSYSEGKGQKGRKEFP